MVLVYIQMNTTLAVFLRDNYGVNEQGFSYILALNAAMVVLFQFPITRRIARYRPLMVMTVGTLLYAVGFAMYGFVSLFFFFLLAMVIITIGEMLVSPVGQAIVTQFAPEDMRGRYMAVFGFSWVIPFAIGPLLAGLVLDNLNPNWLWYAAGIAGHRSGAGVLPAGAARRARPLGGGGPAHRHHRKARAGANLCPGRQPDAGNGGSRRLGAPGAPGGWQHPAGGTCASRSAT